MNTIKYLHEPFSSLTRKEDGLLVEGESPEQDALPDPVSLLVKPDALGESDPLLVPEDHTEFCDVTTDEAVGSVDSDL